MNTGTILIVEDNPVTRESFAAALRGRGHEVLEAGNGRDALFLIRKTLPQVILQDLALPDLDGFELLREFRAIPGAEHLPILAVSGDVSGAGNEGGGFTEFIPKPVKPSYLVQVVEGYLDRRGGVGGDAPGGKHVLVVDDNAVQRKLLKLLLEKRGFRVSVAIDGEDALQRARLSPPDAVVSDVLMPRQDGYELCQGLRQDERFYRIPIVLLSSVYTESGDGDHARACGATTLMTRCPEPEDLEERLLPFLEDPAPADRRRPGRWQPGATHQVRRLTEFHLGQAKKMRLLETGLAMMGGLLQGVRQGGDPGDVLQEVLPRTMDAAGLARGAVYLPNEQGSLSLVAAYGFRPDGQAWLRRMLGAPELLRQVSLDGQSLFLSPADLPKESFPPRDRLRTLFLSPLPLGDGPLGILLVPTGDDAVDADTIDLVKALGRQIGQILTVARSLSQDRERTWTDDIGGRDVATLIGYLLGDDPDQVWEAL